MAHSTKQKKFSVAIFHIYHGMESSDTQKIHWGSGQENTSSQEKAMNGNFAG